MNRRDDYTNTIAKIIFTAIISVLSMNLSAQCNQNFIYGLTNTGNIQRVNVNNGAAAATLNPAFTGNAANLSNALGYSQLNGKYYFFKRNTTTAPQEFVSFDPATNLYANLASAPIAAGSNIINLGCLNNAGLDYYGLDAFGGLYYYSVGTNTWTTICNNIKDQFGTTLNATIGAGSLNRFYGDMAFDGQGNLWIFISGAADYGLYKIAGPLPVTAVANMTATQVIAPNTVSPAGTFGGMAFSSTGSMYLSSNSPSNRLYLLSNVNTLTFVANLSTDGIGNDLTSCNFPLTVLATTWIKFSATVANNSPVLNWNILKAGTATGYAVEYSEDAVSWKQVHFTMKKDDDLAATYTYAPGNLSDGTKYYRIRKTEQDGEISYSVVQKLNTASPVSISLWPNPVQQVLKITTKATLTGTLQAFIYDQEGRMLTSAALKTGANNIAVNGLKAGNYILHVQLSNGQAVNQKFVKN